MGRKDLLIEGFLYLVGWFVRVSMDTIDRGHYLGLFPSLYNMFGEWMEGKLVMRHASNIYIYISRRLTEHIYHT